MTYPCNYCGSYSIWLAACEPDTGLDTKDRVIEACKKYYNCPLPGLKVMTDEKLMEYLKKEKNKNA